jgi:hypothetical protein
LICPTIIVVAPLNGAPLESRGIVGLLSLKIVVSATDVKVIESAETEHVRARAQLKLRSGFISECKFLSAVNVNGFYDGQGKPVIAITKAAIVRMV